MAYDKNNFSKSASNSIINRVIHDCFSVRAQTIKLFETAVTATHSGSQNKKRRFHIDIFYFGLF